jgi:hypothetical protein
MQYYILYGIPLKYIISFTRPKYDLKIIFSASIA